MGETEEFNTLAFEKKLSQLKDTQESIQSLSSWCLKQRTYHKKIVSSWLNVLKRVKVEQRLVLFYLANDVIQYSKRKNYEFVESWGLNLQKATPLVRDEKVRPKILRIFKIWEQRSVYDEEFLTDLTGLLSAGAVKKTDDDPLDFQPQQLFNKIKQCTVLETDTQIKLKCIHDNPLDLADTDELCANLKERSIKDDVEKELNESIQCVERYTQALQRELVAREALLALLTSANQYYSTQRGEVKVVAYAYKNFGSRVRALKRKLDELLPTLPSAPSPPTRDEDVPSPGPDEDLELPANDADVSYNIDQTFNTSVSADGSLYNLGLSSFLNDKTLALFNESESDLKNLNNLKQQDALPGLDLLKEANPPPPTSFYGTMETITIPDEPEQPYLPEAVVTSNQWNNAWNVPLPAPPTHPPANRNVFAEPPASPPVPPRKDAQELPSSELDIRSRLPPPPPPPVLPGLTHLDDVDQRILPSLPPPPVPPPVRHIHQDVDHRNLIPLTQLPAIHLTDQDYRVPPLAPALLPQQPTDIVESVDMDLSEDEEQGMYQNQNQSDHRNSFNNNKVLVGGDKKRNDNANLIQITNESHVGPMSNPFDNMPPALRYNFQRNYQDENRENPEAPIEYDEDIRNRTGRNQSDDYKDEWQSRQYMTRGQFPRNWGPRFRPPYNQFNQRNTRQRWTAPRQRFW